MLMIAYIICKHFLKVIGLKNVPCIQDTMDDCSGMIQDLQVIKYIGNMKEQDPRSIII